MADRAPEAAASAPFRITDVLDIPSLTRLFQALTALNDVVTALLDLDGNILIATGWRNSCTLFHRQHPTTQARCVESDTALASALAEGSRYNVYNCRNGLVDVAVPVRIDGHHVANLFTGQFFSEPPDLQAFRERARLYGFDEEAYIRAIGAVPVFSKDEVERTMAFLTLLAENLGQMGLANLRLAASNAELERHRTELERLVDERTGELRVALQAAQQANAAKGRFLANMSHEIRTPMNAVLGFAGILGRGDDVSPAQRQSLRIIERSGEHLLHLIDDVLEISRLDADRAELRDEVFDLRELLDDVAAMFLAPCDTKGIELLVAADATLPRHVRGDAGKLRQVCINLLGNAVKFAVHGPVSLRASAAVEGERWCLRVAVKGDGPGIAPADHERVFQPFQQSASGIARSDGSGLGLTITCAFVRLMGGDVQVQSDVGQGATFRFEVRLGAVAAADVPKAAPANAAWLWADPPLRVLVADDTLTNRLLLDAMLSPIGIELREACDGAEAVAIARDWHPDFVFMDARMPELDGLQATATLVADPATAAIPVAILSASVLPSEQQAMRDAGACEVLAKPVQLETLLQALARHTRARLRAGPPAKTARKDAQKTVTCAQV